MSQTPSTVLPEPGAWTATAPGTAPLRKLVRDLDGVCAGPITRYESGLRCLLAGLATEQDLLTPQHRAVCRGSYARHVLHADPAGRYTVVALVWDASEFSPVHAHYTWCGYVVIAGTLREEAFVWDAASGSARFVAAAERTAGAVRFGHAGLDTIHRLGNPDDAPAISIHVYGVDGLRVASHVNRIVEPAPTS